MNDQGDLTDKANEEHVKEEEPELLTRDPTFITHLPGQGQDPGASRPPSGPSRLPTGMVSRAPTGMASRAPTGVSQHRMSTAQPVFRAPTRPTIERSTAFNTNLDSPISSSEEDSDFVEDGGY